MYTPDNWVIIKLDSEEYGVVYKVLAGWSGGFTDGDSWRMNSGIIEVRESEDYYDFIGDSGSVYRCYKEAERLSMMTSSILQQLKERFANIVTQVGVDEIELDGA